VEFIRAFITGGILCVIAQLLIDYTKLTPARILVSYVVAGVGLTALGIYDKIVEFGGAGATVPLTGFGYVLANGVKDAVSTQGVLGVITGGLTAAAAGITVVIVFGYLFALIFKSSGK
jgi:stage V sporulation protein AE